MFHFCRRFSADLSKWNVGNVTNMEGMFESCWQFSSDLSNWNVKKVLTVSRIFTKTPKLNKEFIKNWKLEDYLYNILCGE